MARVPPLGVSLAAVRKQIELHAAETTGVHGVGDMQIAKTMSVDQWPGYSVPPTYVAWGRSTAPRLGPRLYENGSEGWVTPDQPAVTITSLAVAIDGSVYAGHSNGAISKRSSQDGSLLWEVQTPTPQGGVRIALDYAGNIYAGGERLDSEDEAFIYRYFPDGTRDEAYEIAGIEVAVKLATDQANNLYVADGTVLRKFDATGNPAPGAWPYADFVDQITGMAVTPTGEVYACDYNRKLVKLAADASEVWSRQLLNIPWDIALEIQPDGHDLVYIANDQHLYMRTTANGGATAQTRTDFPTRHLTMDRHGFLYVAEGNFIRKRDPNRFKILWSYELSEPATSIAVTDTRAVHLP